ncbi:MAG: tandem-95 repeat protein, partial [Hyphomicrobiales bacterium]|nr:tandem-95 repeat protein [Hyphomicrobiales bacterium]
NDIVGQVPASDVDGDTLSYTIIAGNDDGVFDIDGSGNVFVADTSGLDAATTPSYALSVEVSDGEFTDTATINVTISDGSLPSPLLAAGPYLLDGDVSQAAIIAHDDSYLLAGGTMEFTFTADAVDGRRFLFSKDSSGFDAGGHAGVYIEDGAVAVRFQDTAATHVAQTGTLITAGQTHHVAVTFGAAGLIIYVDGAMQAADAYTGGLLGNLEPIVLGANQWSSGNLIANKLLDPFNGALTDVALYGEALGASAVAQLSQAALNDVPVATDDAIGTDVDTPLVIDVAADLLSNDSDGDGDPLVISGFATPTSGGGAVVDNGDGTLTYTPGAGFLGEDTFTYTVSDGQGGEDIATVTVTVADPTNTAPAAVTDLATVNEDDTTTIAVLTNDSDPDGDPVIITNLGTA